MFDARPLPTDVTTNPDPAAGCQEMCKIGFGNAHWPLSATLFGPAVSFQQCCESVLQLRVHGATSRCSNYLSCFIPGSTRSYYVNCGSVNRYSTTGAQRYLLKQ
jgi:hypothetical protein